MARSVAIDFVGKDRLSRIMGKVQGGFKKIKTGTDKAEAALKKYNARQKKTAKGMKAMGKLKGFLGAAALIGGGKKALSEAATAETATLKVLSNITDAQEKIRLAPKIRAALEDAGKLGIPMEEAGRALFTMTSQLGATDATFSKFRGSMKLSVGGFADFESAVSVTNKLMEQFDNLGDDSEKTARQIFEAQVLGDTDVQKLALALPTAAGAAKVAGLKSEEFLSVIAASTKRTKNTAASAESLKALIAQFQNVEKGSARAKAFRKLGIAPGTEALREQGFLNIMQKLVKMREQKGGQELIDKAFTGEGAKVFLNNMDQEMIDAFTSGAVKIREGSGLELSFQDVSTSIAATMAKASADMNTGWAIIGEKMVPSMNALSSAITRADKTSDEGEGSFLGSLASDAFFGSLRAVFGETDEYKAKREAERLEQERAEAGTGNLDAERSRAAEGQGGQPPQEVKVKIDVSNGSDSKVGVTTEGVGLGDLGLQERGA